MSKTFAVAAVLSALALASDAEAARWQRHVETMPQLGVVRRKI